MNRSLSISLALLVVPALSSSALAQYDINVGAATINGNGNVAAAMFRTINGSNNVVIGTSGTPHSVLNADNTVIVGTHAIALHDNGIAIGYRSIASTDAGVAGYDPVTKASTTDTSAAWKATGAAVSIGAMEPAYEGDGSFQGVITRQINAVAAGTADTDAVNVAQLKRLASTIQAGSNANYDELNQQIQQVDNRVTVLGDQVTNPGDQVTTLDSKVTNLGDRLNDVDHRINKVGAGAAALAGLHPLDFDPDDKWNFAASVGHYNSANAIAVGAFYRPNENTMFSAATNLGNGENMLNVGVSLKFGSGNKYMGMSKSEMAQALTKLDAHNKKLTNQLTPLQEQVASQQQEIARLQNLVNQLAAKAGIVAE
jgi:autotransporter adhesin/uncharacterized coiled-coil protein SlyX